jgi:hypothetical protein
MKPTAYKNAAILGALGALALTSGAVAVESPRDRQRRKELADKTPDRNEQDTKMAKRGALYGKRTMVDANDLRQTQSYEIQDMEPMPDLQKFESTEALPDRLCGDDTSEFYHADCGSVGVEFDGKIRPNDVVEYCISEGWIRVQIRMNNGKIMMRHGKKYTRIWRGEVKPFLKSERT